MYHSFSKKDIFFNVDMQDFILQIDYLVSSGYKFVKISKLIEILKNKDDLKKVVALTFDDGHIDFYNKVFPILKSKNIEATLYWPTGMENNILLTTTGTTCQLMNVDQVKEISLSGLVEFGSHGVTHRELTKISDEDLESELINSKKELELISGKEVFSVAYPRGKYNKNVINFVQKVGYSCGLSVKEGSINSSSSIFALNRLSIDRTTSMLSFRAKLSALYDIVSKWKKF